MISRNYLINKKEIPKSRCHKIIIFTPSKRLNKIKIYKITKYIIQIDYM